MPKNPHNLYNFKIITPYEKGGKVFSFSYEDHNDKVRKYEVRKTESPVSNYNMQAFWRIIDKYDGKQKVPNIWMIPELRQMDQRGYVKIENMNPAEKDDPLQMELPLQAMIRCLAERVCLS